MGGLPVGSVLVSLTNSLIELVSKTVVVPSQEFGVKIGASRQRKGLLLRADVSGRKIEDATPPDRVLDG